MRATDYAASQHLHETRRDLIVGATHDLFITHRFVGGI